MNVTDPCGNLAQHPAQRPQILYISAVYCTIDDIRPLTMPADVVKKGQKDDNIVIFSVKPKRLSYTTSQQQQMY